MYDSAAWTGRKRRTFPRYAISVQTPWFYLRIGPLWNMDAYGADLAWGKRQEILPGDIAYRHNRTWCWWTAQELMDG